MIHTTAKVSEEVNGKCHPRNTNYTMIQLSTPFIDSECHSAQCHRHRQIDRQTTVSRQQPSCKAPYGHNFRDIVTSFVSFLATEYHCLLITTKLYWFLTGFVCEQLAHYSKSLFNNG